MKTKFAKMLPLLLAIVIVSALVTAFGIMSSAADFSSAVDAWFRNADSFNTNFTRNNAGAGMNVTAGNDGSLTVTTTSATGTSDWFPAAMTAPIRLSDLNGAQVKFKLDDGFNFGNYNAFNGSVSFTWANALAGVGDSYVKGLFTPSKLEYNRYYDVLNGNTLQGGLAQQLKANNLQALCVTLFPHQNGSDSMSRHVSYVQVYATNGATYSGNVSIDLSSPCEIEVARVSGTTFSVKINGSTICTLNTGFVDTTGGLNNLTVWTSHSNSSPSSFRTNYSIIEMNYFPAAAFPTAAYDVFAQIRALPQPSEIQPSDEAAVTSARSAYNALSETMKTWMPDDVMTKLALCEAAFAPSSGFVLVDSSTTPTDINIGLSSFATGTAKKLTLLDGADLLTPVTVKKDQTLIINSGASANSVSGEKGAKLEIGLTGFANSINPGKAYVANANGEWEEIVPEFSIRGATILRANNPLSLSTQSLKFGAHLYKNAAASSIRDYGIVYLPAIALGSNELTLATPTAAMPLLTSVSSWLTLITPRQKAALALES